MNTLFMHCRPGFEGEVCSEISEHAARLNVAGYAKAKTASAYAEFICVETFWPDFGRGELIAALEAFAGRQRRFGAL